MKMDKIGDCAVTYMSYLQLKGVTLTSIHADMMSTLGDDVPSFATVNKWTAEFKRGWESLKDATTKEMLIKYMIWLWIMEASPHVT